MHWNHYRYHTNSMAGETAARAENKAMSLQARCDLLEDRIDTLGLVCQAMWELLSESQPDLEQALSQRVEEIDLRDGKRDGKLSRVQRECPRCDRPLHQRHRSCMYCGEITDQENLFQE